MSVNFDKVGFAELFGRLQEGELSWLFLPENSIRYQEVSDQFRDWLVDNNLAESVQNDPILKQAYAGYYLDQVKHTLQPPTLPTYRTPAPATIVAQPDQPKSVTFQKITIDVQNEYFETEQGQWMLWFLCLGLTILDWVTNVWALTQSLDIGAGLENATIWHWALGGVLVFSEIYLGIVRSLWRRTPKDRAQEVVILIVLWIVVLLAIGYDFFATLIPPYNAIGGLGGIITGLLLAAITTIGSSYFLQQSQIVWQLFKQRRHS